MTAFSRIRHPRAVSTSYTAAEVARAYNYPANVTGKGYTCGIVELGGGYSNSDLTACGIDPARVKYVELGGGKNKSDGPNGADGEVLLDIEVVAEVAPGADILVVFAPNSDSGFLQGFQYLYETAKVDVVTCSWGGPESSWTSASMDAFNVAFGNAKAALINTFCASGDTGANDGTRRPTVDFPASSPNVIGCGGTRLTLNADGTRKAETAWNDNPTSSATGGGVSTYFKNRQVPDVAGNADPQTGYQTVVDGEGLVIGGTSAVAPLYAGLTLLLMEATGGRFDFLKAVMAEPTVCYDVVSGDPRTGPGRDQATGLGVVDGAKLLAALGTTVTPPPPPPVIPPPVTPPTDADAAFAAQAQAWLDRKPYFYRAFQKQVRAWLATR